MLADDVSVADAEVTAFTGETFVERIGTQHGPGRNGISLSESGPALHVDVRLEHAIAADADVRFNHAEIADARPGADRRIRMHAGSGRY